MGVPITYKCFHNVIFSFEILWTILRATMVSNIFYGPQLKFYYGFYVARYKFNSLKLTAKP